MESNSEEELIARYEQGDKEALGMLAHRYKTQVFNFAYRILGNRADAEDVTSDTMLQLVQRRYSRSSEAKLTTWLFTVAHHASIDRIRKRQQFFSFWMKKDDSDDYEQWDAPDPKDIADEDLKKREMLKSIRKEIDRLPFEQREALVLREYFDKSYAEIAQILNCSLEKVKVLIFRGREQLRANLVPQIKEGL